MNKHASSLPQPSLLWVLISLLAFGFAFSARAGSSSSASYSIAADTLSAGGTRTASGTLYTNEGSLGGVVGVSTAAAPALTAKNGFIGQLFVVDHLHINSPGTINELGTLQLSLIQVLDDNSALATDPAQIAWETTVGPAIPVSSSGLASAGAVFADTLSTIRATYAGDFAIAQLNILNTILDNFGIYGGDDLSDEWQVQYFGQDNPLAAPGLDPDGDGLTNLFEFTAGLLPNSRTSRFTMTLENVPGQPGQKRMVFQPALTGRTFTLLKSTTLLPGSWLAVPGAVTAGNDGTQTLTDPAASGGRAFYQVQINLP